MFSAQDYRFMGRAIELAKLGRYTTTPNPCVGCVLVNQGAIVAEGHHLRAGQPHAEVHALQAAQSKAQGAVAYVTLEPCAHQGRTPPCSQALIEAGVKKVIIAMQDPNPQVAGSGLQQLADAGIETACGLMQEQARRLNVGFISRMTRKRPYVRVKMAASLDGRTALADGESRWITGSDARADVHRLRARSCAIVTGVGTVLADDPSFTVRTTPQDYPGAVRQPIRVICDSHLRIPLNANVLTLPGETWVITCRAGKKKQALEDLGASVIVLDGCKGRLALDALLRRLAQAEINDVLVEAGATLAGAFVQARLADELWLYQAPHLMGDAAKGLLHLPELTAMKDRIELTVRDVRCIGSDIRLRAFFD